MAPLYTTYGEMARREASCLVTIHKDSTLVLMELLQKAGLPAYVGKVNMDRNSPEFLIEDTHQSLADTKEWLEASAQFGPLVKPIITPRFVPSCTSELMRWFR